LRKDYNQQNLTGIVDYAKTAGKKTGIVTLNALCGAMP
jgi:alkaline phosphatase